MIAASCMASSTSSSDSVEWLKENSKETTTAEEDAARLKDHTSAFTKDHVRGGSITAAAGASLRDGLGDSDIRLGKLLASDAKQAIKDFYSNCQKSCKKE